MTALDDVLTPFAMIYEVASLTLGRIWDRLNHSAQRYPS
jgi:hypothetical protein